MQVSPKTKDNRKLGMDGDAPEGMKGRRHQVMTIMLIQHVVLGKQLRQLQTQLEKQTPASQVELLAEKGRPTCQTIVNHATLPPIPEA